METGIFKNFIFFIKKPDNNKKEDMTSSQKLIELLKLYLITLLFAMLISIVNKILIKLGAYGEYTQNLGNLPKLHNKAFIWTYLIFGLVWPPIIEEFAFRLLLTKYNKKFISISISLITGLAIYRLFYSYLWHPQSSIIFNTVSYLYPVIFAIPIFATLHLIRFNFSNLWKNNFTLVFYLITLTFALFHIFTLNITTTHLYYLPIVVLPFILFGISLGFARIRFGILYSIILHFLFNAPVIIKIMLSIN